MLSRGGVDVLIRGADRVISASRTFTQSQVGVLKCSPRSSHCLMACSRIVLARSAGACSPGNSSRARAVFRRLCADWRRAERAEPPPGRKTNAPSIVEHELGSWSCRSTLASAGRTRAFEKLSSGPSFWN